ncbi:MAG: nitronate monooxygenase, partial [Proteobacteria bacterium]
MPNQPFIDSLGLKVPLIVAPMAGGPSSVNLVVASSEAGALGSIGGAYLSAEGLTAAIKAVRAITSRPFAVNLFIPGPAPVPTAADLARAVAATKKFRAALSLPAPALAPPFAENFDRQFEVVLREKPAAFSFVFGLLDENYLLELRRAKIFVIGTATTAEEAQALEASGVDALVAQGTEAGGHRGMFRQQDPEPGVSAFALLREVKAKCALPVIAAGGIMSAAQIEAMLAAGAAA